MFRWMELLLRFVTWISRGGARNRINDARDNGSKGAVYAYIAFERKKKEMLCLIIDSIV